MSKIRENSCPKSPTQVLSKVRTRDGCCPLGSPSCRPAGAPVWPRSDSTKHWERVAEYLCVVSFLREMLFIYTARAREVWGQGQSEGKGPRLRATPDLGLRLMSPSARPEPKWSQKLNCLSHPGTPVPFVLPKVVSLGSIPGLLLTLECTVVNFNPSLWCIFIRNSLKSVVLFTLNEQLVYTKGLNYLVTRN